MTAFIPLIVLIAGLLFYALAANPKVVECGRIAFFCGLFVLVLQYAGKTVHLLGG